jgi:hypothetical protein
MRSRQSISSSFRPSSTSLTVTELLRDIRAAMTVHLHQLYGGEDEPGSTVSTRTITHLGGPRRSLSGAVTANVHRVTGGLRPLVTRAGEAGQRWWSPH